MIFNLKFEKINLEKIKNNLIILIKKRINFILTKIIKNSKKFYKNFYKIYYFSNKTQDWMNLKDMWTFYN